MSEILPIKNISHKDYLSDQEISDIEHECSIYEERAAAGIDALLIVQKQRGWISDESLYAIADLLQMSAAQLEGVATFYNLIYRKPVGKNVIHVCDSISCWLHRYENIAQHLQNKLGLEFGQTSEDGLFTLTKNVCLGSCDKAPAVMINGDIIDNITIDKIDTLINQIVNQEVS